MGADYDVQSAVESLRSEIQKDRIATQQMITEGFSNLTNNMDTKYSNLTERVGIVEDRQKWFGRGLLATVAAFGSAFAAHIFGGK